MSERYLKLFSLEENLYIPGSPVLIAAGAVSSETFLCTEDFQELLFALEFFGILVR